MTLKSASQTQIQTRNRTRRRSACYLHPTDPVTGICASCLRERLSGLDSPSSTATHLGNGGAGAEPSGSRNRAAAPSPELRRSRSVCAVKCEASAGFDEPRRKSCDIRARNGSSLAHLFDVDDERGGSNADSKVESRNILGSPAIEMTEGSGNENGGDWGHLPAALRVESPEEDTDEGEVEEGDMKTMKEYIDLELQSKSQKVKDFKELAGNLWEAASVFSKKLQKWRQKHKVKKLSYCNERGICDGNGDTNGLKGQNLGDTQSEVADYAVGRRSCDTEPRFSVDGGRLSVDGGRISFDEPRASWDGYLIARTIPRLAPMLSVVDNAMLGGGNRFDNHRVSVDGQMQSITEDETSSGGSGQSNSDSSSSQRRSSFDRSSSVRSFGKKTMGLEGDDIKYLSNAKVSPAKLVITERELKDWHLNSMKDDHVEKLCVPKDATAVEDIDNLGPKKTVRWRKVWNAFGLKQKPHEKKSESSMASAVDCLLIDACEKQQKEVAGEVKDTAGWKLTRSSSIVGARRSFDVSGSNHARRSISNDSECARKGREELMLGRNQSVKHTTSNFDDGTLPFYLTPLRSSRSRRSGRNSFQLN